MSKPILAAMLSLSTDKMTAAEKKLLEKYNPLGISLFARNLKTPEQIKKLTSEIREAVGRKNILIAVDQEGGRVRRLKEPYFRAYAGQQTLGRLWNETTPQIAQKAAACHASLIAADLKELGINLNYAPVLDVLAPETSPVLSSRIFSDIPEIVANLGEISVKNYMQNNIIPCIKHLPGHGRAAVDPHLNLPVIDASLKELEKDFYPFQKLNDTPCGMTAHIVVSVIDKHFPVTQSSKGIKELIRGIIGFKGFLISDSIDMHALGGSLGEKTSTALNAGCDAVCYCAGKEEEIEEVCRAASPLSDHALERLAKMENVLAAPPTAPDITTLEKNYKTILGQIEPYRETYDATEVLFQMQRRP